MRTFESEPMQIPMPRSSSALDRREAVAEVRLGRRAERRRARPRAASRSSSCASACVAWTTVVRAEAARAGEQLDRADAVLGEALLDLARLLVGVDVERQPLGGRVARRSPRASPPGTRGRSGGRPRRGRRAARSVSTWPQVLGGPTPAGSGGCRRARMRRRSSTSSIPASAAASTAASASGEAEVVELADGRVAGARAARGRRPRSPGGPSRASAAPPRAASPRATPRSRRPRRVRAARAGTRASAR